MPINTISLLTGALSFSAALAWNKAISDGLQKVSEKYNTSFIQAMVTTIIIIITVFIINSGILLYTHVKDTKLQEHIKNAGKNPNSKVKLWLF